MDSFEAGIGNKMFDVADRNRIAFDPFDAMAFTLRPMVTDQRADDGQGVVFKQHLRSGHGFVFFEQPDHFRDIGIDWAAFPTSRIAALQALFGLFEYVTHPFPPWIVIQTDL